MKVKYFTLTMIASVLVACGTTEPTIDNLGKRKLNLEEPEISAIERKQVIDRYKQFVEVAKDSPLYGEAMRRLADLELEEGEARNLTDNQAEIQAGTKQTKQAIKLYNSYLITYPKQADNDLILYQLAKAYTINGDAEEALSTLNRLVKEHPDSRYIEETQFRRGELFFVFRDYANAERAYFAVVDEYKESIYYEKSLYKYGWSLYKQNKYKLAQSAYLKFFDHKYSIGKLSVIEFPESLSKGEKELMQDTLRVFVLSFTYQDGAESLKNFFVKEGHRSYEPMIYDYLGTLYLKKERLTDAADTYLAFVAQNPVSPYAPRFHTNAIDAYKKGGFAKLVLTAKEEFVKRYGVDSQYWKIQSEADRKEIQPYLTLHIRELASHYHALARKSKKPQDFQIAASWYGTYLRSFPQDKDAPQINFLLAESLFDGQRYEQAIAEFEKTAYQYPAHAKSAEAGYAALLSYNKLDKQLQVQKQQQQQRAEWRQKAIDSALMFSSQFPTDKRVPAVLVKTSEELYALKSYQRAADTAQIYLQKEGEKDSKLKATALIVYGHSEFELKNYAVSEVAYREILQTMNRKDKQYAGIYDRLAASIYKQGEEAKNKGDLKLASFHYLRVGQVVPASSMVATAQYDGATMLIQSGQYNDAAKVLEGFRKQFPKDHKLQSGVTEKLAVIYTQTGQGAKAATEMLALAAISGDANYKRDMVWQAANLYEKSGSKQKALTTYKDYVKKYPRPLEQAVEARHYIAEYYRKSNNPKEWGHWLNEIIIADSKGGSERSARTNYLAADATLHLASPYRNAYKQARLTVPLKKSLKKKKKLMQNTIKAYERALQYKVAEVTTSATYQIAEVYHDFARALMESERPRGLNEEEQEQYVLLLEEQAYPFEEKAMDIHTANLDKMKTGLYDKWIKSSLKIMQEMQPGRYARNEKVQAYVEAIN